MIIAVLLWVIVGVCGILIVTMVGTQAFSPPGGVAMGVLLLIIFLCVRGLDRNEASQVCDAINDLGGQASFAAGKCLIKNDGGFPIDKESDRYVYLTQP